MKFLNYLFIYKNEEALHRFTNTDLTQFGIFEKTPVNITITENGGTVEFNHYKIILAKLKNLNIKSINNLSFFKIIIEQELYDDLSEDVLNDYLKPILYCPCNASELIIKF